MRTLLPLLVTMVTKVIALSIHPAKTTRRKLLYDSSRVASIILFPVAIDSQFADVAVADEEENTYSNPNIPAAPEERSGLIVLRVAEVAQFQG